MEAATCFETLVPYPTAIWRHNQKDQDFNLYRREVSCIASLKQVTGIFI